jgi:DMSO/TMAO reductase YedYZ molybdopterin-dependent catalytic subunit
MSIINVYNNSDVLVIGGRAAGSAVCAMRRSINMISLITSFYTMIAFGQEANTSTNALLTVSGEMERPLKLSLADLSKLPRHSVQAKDHDGKESKYEGVMLGEILQQAGVKFGKDLRGKALATYLLADAADGYQAVFALTELDSAFTDRVILLADRCDDRPLPASNGPFQIIVPHEKRHARWVRQVTTLTLHRAPENPIARKAEK